MVSAVPHGGSLPFALYVSCVGDVRNVIETAGECFNTRRLDDLDGLVSDSMVNHAAGPQGLAGWKQVWQAIYTCFPDAVAETHQILIDGDSAAVHMTIEGTHEASSMPLLDGIPPSHKKVRWRFIHLFKVADGRIVEHDAVRDDLGLLRQIQG
ncbi:MAG: ester cyclase [Mycobacteriales bacterium]